MFFWIATGAWLAGVIISFNRGNLKLPLIILILGILDIAGMFFLNFGWLGLSALALMAVIIHIVNKLASL